MRARRIKGVYAILHEATGSIYIGVSVDINSRWVTHRRELRQGKHHNKPLQAAWDRDGADAFRFTILHEFPQSRQDRPMYVAENWWMFYFMRRQGGERVVYNADGFAGELRTTWWPLR